MKMKIVRRGAAIPGCSRLLGGALLITLPLAAFAGQTRTWTQGDFSDYDKAILKNLSLRSDGRLSLAPKSRELFDTGTPYLWALAQDSKGVLYAGGGTNAKLFRIGADGKGKLLAELDGLEIHALAIDARDRVYAATSPDGKIYRLNAAGKPEVFYDPKAKYIWALAFGAQGDLFAATGDQGEIHRIAPDGKGKVFFRTEEAHVRSLAIDAKGNLIVGTEPGGLVVRVSPAGEGFVLYQMPKREVTAVAVAPDGAIWASGVGVKQAAPAAPSPGPPPPAAPPTGAVSVSVGGPVAAAPRQPAPPQPSVAAPAVTGGSEVYRIDPDGAPRRMWSSAADIVYSIAFDASGRAIAGSGNKGNIIRIESPSQYTALLTVPSTQVTGLIAARDGRLLAATGNTGKVYEIGPGLEREGTVESDVFDAGGYTLWGRLSFEAALHGGRVSVTSRSGNLDQPQKNWSPWSAAITAGKGGRVASPAARFVQWKATLSGDGAQSPELDSVDVAYLPKNLEPRIDEIETTPANYKFPPAVTPIITVTPALSLPPIGKRTPTAGFSSDITPAMQYAKGWIGARWAASDPNGDPLVFTVEIKGAAEKEWKLLKDKVNERYISWDSTAFPDGEYRVRVTASDAPGNPPSEALSARMESNPFWIDNTPPKISGLTAARAGNKLEVRWHAADALNNIAKAEYSLDGGEWKVAAPVTRLSDSPELDYVLSLDAPAGEHTVAVRVQDDYDNQSVEKTVAR
jgi:hypothetical protein